MMITAESLIPVAVPRFYEGPDLYSGERDTILLRLFGLLPDYANPGLERVWQELNRRSEREIAEICRKKGIEVLKRDGTAVSCALDIAALLLANERGIVSLQLHDLDGDLP